MTLKNKFLYEKIYHKGGWLGDTLGGLTGGLIGNDPAEEAKKETEREKQEQEALIKQQEEDRKKEEAFNKEVSKDTENIQNSMTNEETKKGKPTTTVDFSGSIKGTGKDDEEEDKLKKYMTGAFRR